MKKNISSMSKTFVILLIILSNTFFLCGTAKASVKLLSQEQYTEHPNGEIYWEITVTCSGNSNKRIIQRASNGEKWCSKEVKNICHSNKVSAASKVCSQLYRRKISDQKNNKESSNTTTKKATKQKKETVKKVATKEIEVKPTTSKTSNPISDSVFYYTKTQTANDPIKEQIDIEEQRIQIEQKKLELRRQELELQKREFELKKNQPSKP